MRLPVYEQTVSRTCVRKSACGAEGFVCVCEYGLAELLAQEKDVFQEAVRGPQVDPPWPLKHGG